MINQHIDTPQDVQFRIGQNKKIVKDRNTIGDRSFTGDNFHIVCRKFSLNNLIVLDQIIHPHFRHVIFVADVAVTVQFHSRTTYQVHLCMLNVQSSLSMNPFPYDEFITSLNTSCRALFPDRVAAFL